VTEKRIADMSLGEKADAAFRRAMKKVIQRAKDTGTPVIVWEDGAIKEIPCDQLDALAAERLSEEDSD